MNMRICYLFYGLIMEVPGSPDSRWRLKGEHIIAGIVLFTVFLYLLEPWASGNTLPSETADTLTELTPETFPDSIAGRTCFVLFYEEDSELCDRMEYSLCQLANRQDEEVAFFKFNIDKYPDYIITHKISGTPSILIFKNGKEAKRILGIISEKNLKTIYNKFN